MKIKEFEKMLEKALSAQSETILEAMDFGFRKVDKRFGKLENRMDRMEEQHKKMQRENLEQHKRMERENLEQHKRICKQLADLEQESKISWRLYQEHERWLERHERRITCLEAG